MILRSHALPAQVARDPAIRRILGVARDTGVRLLLVGGFTRDALAGRPVRDTDFILAGPSRPFLEALSRALGRRVVTFRKRGLTDHRLTWRNREFDFVELGARSLDEELHRRDFSVNAMAFDPEDGRLIDPTGGMGDLRRDLIRANGPGVFLDDPLRMLRAVRLAAEIPSLRVEAFTLDRMRLESPRIVQAAPERVREELDRTLGTARASWALRTLDRTGLLSPWIPEIDPLRGLEQNRYHHLDAWEHTLAAIEAADRPGLLARGVLPAGPPGTADLSDLRWALLLHDLGKAEAREMGPDGQWRFYNHHLASERLAGTILRRLRFSRRRMSRVRRLIREHLRIVLLPDGTLSLRARRRIVRDLGEDTPLLILHGLADQRATRGRHYARARRALRQECRELHALFLRQAKALTRPPRLVDGHEVMAVTGTAPGPLVGQWLARIRELQLDGVLNSREETLAWLRKQ